MGRVEIKIRLKGDAGEVELSWSHDRNLSSKDTMEPAIPKAIEMYNELRKP